ncbi:helix-turn-helix domain-containing protein [Escherichia coli]|nr:helix-turn-helix domain-containing protein [Escherichia coli]MCV5941934.1 helix-turn-helix domain-containing protein [Escherichia coli]MCV6038449.1 helix-turn-helix domain-containing protein [Escherichia coli]
MDRSAVLADLAGGDSIRTVATRHGISTRTVQNIKAEANQAG